MGEVGCAFVVIRTGHSTVESEIIDWCREQLANFKVPRTVRLLDHLPLGATGKLDKAALSLMVPSTAD